MRSLLISLFVLSFSCPLWAQKELKTPFEQSNKNQTPTYHEVITWWQQFAKANAEVEIKEMGLTDSGFPLHLVVISLNKEFDFAKLQHKNRLLINNGIHPGEPDGIDASMLFARDVLKNKQYRDKLANTVIAIVPVYNIGGALNRNSTSRVNQQGPEQHGFRGNARNYDLNRDFIKADTRNALAFAEIFHWVNPDVFLDTHVSNGADYQYVMTNLPTQHNKLGGDLGHYLENNLVPQLESHMSNAGTEMTPYVNVWGSTPDKGWNQFMDWPRYSTGYTTLFHTLGFMTETHMLKPYQLRVQSTYNFMQGLIEVLYKDGEHIKSIREKTLAQSLSQTEFPINWKHNKEAFKQISFKGYEGSRINSEVTGQSRLYYDQKKPYEKTVPFYNQYEVSQTVIAPKAYVIPQGWHTVIERLRANKVQMKALDKDTTIQLAVYYIENFETFKSPFEGHYMHYNTQVRKEYKTIALRKGDWIIETRQTAKRYLIETLEPQAPDSYFNWNFFDTILQQKEGYSDYVFEDLALEIIQTDPSIKEALEKKKASDPAFAENGPAQLDFIYKLSDHYEAAHMRLPIFRLE